MNTEADPQAGSIDQAVPGGKPWVRWGGFAASVALLAACIYYASTETDWSHVRQARTEHIAGLVGLLVAGLVLNALMFQLALLPFEGGERPGWLEWQALMGVSALLNFLPKIGLVARVAYLKKQHDVGYRVHVLSLVLVGVGTAAVYGVIVPAIFWRADFDAIWIALTIAGMVVFATASVPVVRLVGRGGLRPVSTRSLLVGAGAWYLLRVADSFCFAGRLYFAAEIFGSPMPLSTALAVGVLCNFIVMFAPLPGGLGLREWVGGLLLNTSLTQGIGVKTGMSLLLVDRGAEVAVFVAAGLIGFGLLAWWRDRAAAET